MRQVVRRIYWRLMRCIGLNQFSWDKQFEAGVWCRGPQSSQTIRMVRELCAGGVLVEFGAGEGTLPLALPKNSFSQYFGYDISGVAIRRAREKMGKAGFSNFHLEQCDMAEWKGTSGISLIVLEECLYYLAPRAAEVFLRRCVESLDPNGSILVIVHSALKHHRMLELCRRICEVREESVFDGRTFLSLGKKPL